MERSLTGTGSGPQGCSGPRLVFPRTLSKKHNSIPKLLHQREISGTSFPLRGVRAWNRLCNLRMPRTVQVNNECFDLLRDGVFLGMSNDSGYVVTVLHGSSSERYTGVDVDMVLTVMQLTPTRLVPAFTARLRTDRLFEVFATFPRDSSFISVLSFTEDVTRHGEEPVTTLVALDMVLFKSAIHLSMRTSVVLSCRWRNRICRSLVRCFSQGVVVNAGATLVCITVTSTTPPVDHPPKPHRSVFQVLRVDEAISKEWAGVVLQEIKVCDARPTTTNVAPPQYRLHPLSAEEGPIDSHNMREAMFMTEVVLDIEKLLNRLAPRMVQAFLRSHEYVGLIDYEVEVLGCEGFNVFVMVTVIIEVKAPGRSGANRPHMGIVELQWNTSDGTLHHRCWRPLKPMYWDKAHRPTKWYPFQPKRTPGIDELVISNEAFLSGESLKMLTSPFPGIGLVR